jgi:hypothetical protein
MLQVCEAEMARRPRRTLAGGFSSGCEAGLNAANQENDGEQAKRPSIADEMPLPQGDNQC